MPSLFESAEGGRWWADKGLSQRHEVSLPRLWAGQAAAVPALQALTPPGMRLTGLAEQRSSSAQARQRGQGWPPASCLPEGTSSILPAISSANMPKINLDMEIRLQGKAQGKKKFREGNVFMRSDSSG